MAPKCSRKSVDLSDERKSLQDSIVSCTGLTAIGLKKLQSFNVVGRLDRDQCPVTNSLASLPKMPTTSTPHHTASASTMLTTSQHQQQLVSGLCLQSATFQNCTVNFYTGSAAPTESRNTPATIRKRRRVFIDSDSDSDSLGLLSRVNSKSTYMAFVMQGLHFCVLIRHAWFE